MRKALRSVAGELAPFLSTTCAAATAWLSLQSSSATIAVFAVAGVVIIFFASAFELGANQLPQQPISAVKLMNFSAGLQWVISALGSALVIVTGIRLLPADDLSSSQAEVFGAFAGGVVAFVTATTAALSGERAENRLAARVSKAFQSAYLRPKAESSPANQRVHHFAPSSAGERWVHASNYQGASGWDSESRRIRAEGIEAELRSGASNPIN